MPIEGTRAGPAAALAQKIANYSQKPCLIAAGIADGLEIADRRAKQDELILVTGSFYAVGPALERLQQNAAYACY